MHNKHGRRNHRVVPPKTVEALSINAILAAYEHQAGERRARAAFGGFIRSSDQGSLGYLVAPDVKDDSKSWQAGNVRSLGKSVRLATTLPFAICDRHLRPFENRSGVRNSFGAINSDSKNYPTFSIKYGSNQLISITNNIFLSIFSIVNFSHQMNF